MHDLLDEARIKEQLVKSLEISKNEAGDLLSKFDTDFKKLRLISPIDFLLYFESKLPKDEKILRTLFYISTLESIVAAKKNNSQKVKLVSAAMIKNLSSEEKIKLLGGFLFSETYKFGQGELEVRHLMFQDMMADEGFSQHDYLLEEQTKYCGTNGPNYLCPCIEWLEEKGVQDIYIPELVKRFGSMRGAMLHEAFPVIWFPDFEHDPNITTFFSTLVDAHPTDSDLMTFRSYESGIDSSEFYRWIKKIILGHIRET